MVGTILLTSQDTKARRYRILSASAFFSTLAPLIYFYIQHKVHRIAGGEYRVSPRGYDTHVLIAGHLKLVLRHIRMESDLARCRFRLDCNHGPRAT